MMRLTHAASLSTVAREMPSFSTDATCGHEGAPCASAGAAGASVAAQRSPATHLHNVVQHKPLHAPAWGLQLAVLVRGGQVLVRAMTSLRPLKRAHIACARAGRSLSSGHLPTAAMGGRREVSPPRAEGETGTRANVRELLEQHGGARLCIGPLSFQALHPVACVDASF